MDEIRFSIIIPVYHTEKYLEQCLDSVVSQTYRNLQIILVHDRTGDRSGEICDSYARKDKRITVVHREKGDVSSARNTGLDMATGDYIIFVDSDDWIELNYCEEMRKTIHSHGLVDMVKTDYFMEGQKACLMRVFCKDEFEICSTDEREGLQLAVLSGHCSKDPCDGLKNREADPASIWAGAYRKDIISSVRFQGSKCEDVLFNLYAIQKCKRIVYKPVALYHYRQNEGSAVIRYNPCRVEEYTLFYEKCFGFMEENEKEECFYLSLAVRMLSHIIVNINYTITHPDSFLTFSEKREKLRSMMNAAYYKQILGGMKQFRYYSVKVRFILLLLRMQCYGAVILLGEMQWKLKKYRKLRQ